jgi:hypothetical protein
MRYLASEKAEIIRLVEQSPLPCHVVDGLAVLCLSTAETSRSPAES